MRSPKSFRRQKISEINDSNSTAVFEIIDKIVYSRPKNTIIFLILSALELSIIPFLFLMFSWANKEISAYYIGISGELIGIKGSQGLILAWLFLSCMPLTFWFYVIIDDNDNFKIMNHVKKINRIDARSMLQFLLIPACYSLLEFGGAIYPIVPASLGGGQPRLADVVWSQGGSKDRVVVIDENSTEIFLVVNENESKTPIQIKKSEIKRIDYVVHLDATKHPPPAPPPATASTPAPASASR